MKLPKGWRMKAIGDISDVAGGIQKGPHREATANPARYVTVAHVQRNRLLLDDPRFFEVTPEELQRWRLLKDDVLIIEGNGSADQIGRTALFRGEIENCVHQNHVIRVRPHSHEVSGEYLNSLMNSSVGQAAVQIQSNTSSGLRTLSVGKIREMYFPFPPLPEQRKIAGILSTWDEALETLDSLIAAKDRQKQALMQQLLTGKTRVKGFDASGGKTKRDRYGVYPADWIKVALADILNEVSARNAEGDDLPVLSCTKHRGLVLSQEYFGKRVHAEDTSGYRVVRRGEFAYATNHIEEGSIGYQNLVDAGLVSPIYTVFQTKGQVDDNYLFRVLKSPLLIHFYQINTSASVDRRGSLRYDEFSRIRIWLPSKAEQVAIASILDTADAELTLLRAQRQTLDQQKRGLMQRLLTGKIRVKKNYPNHG